MRAWLALKLTRHTMARLREGDPGPTLALDTDDVILRFPGLNSWAGEFKGKEAVAAWLDRFTQVGLQSFPDEVTVNGPPWRMTLAIRGHISLHDQTGNAVYDNRYVIWGSLRWGRLTEYEVYEDTQKSAALDDYLATLEVAG
jgi:ketosteroid isomerase-like protein